jgi:hypothetical protein
MQAAILSATVFLGLCLVFSAFLIMSVKIYTVRPDFILKILRYVVILFFWAGFSVAAVSIGVWIDSKHKSSYERNLKSVNQIWGGSLVQEPPSLTYETLGEREYEDKSTGAIKVQTTTIEKSLGFESQILNIEIKKNIRKKGLLIFPGYNLDYSASYTFKNPTNKTSKIRFYMGLPSNSGNINNISVLLDGKTFVSDGSFTEGLRWTKNMEPNETHTFQIQYKAQGTKTFTYSLGSQPTQIKKLLISLTTDYDNFLIPDSSMVPSKEVLESGNNKLIWEIENLVSGQNISLDFILEGNYGEVASKFFLYSPLALFLFLISILLFTSAKEISLHPMNYLFILASFFVFYLLGSYLISYINIIYGILLSLFISSGIILYYIKLLNKGKLLINIVSISTLIFQWFFSIAFFFPEHTGLLITISSIIAFVILLKSTATTNWEDKF